MTSMDITSGIELYDSDILKIEQGPLAWANQRVGSRRNIDQFVKDLTEQFAEIGFLVDVSPWTTREEGTYAFKVEIRQRATKVAFDFERMQHEVRSNILEIPGAGGTIKFDEKEFLRQYGNGKHKHAG